MLTRVGSSPFRRTKTKKGAFALFFVLVLELGLEHMNTAVRWTAGDAPWSGTTSLCTAKATESLQAHQIREPPYWVALLFGAAAAGD